jgi:hypothetical protein
MKVLGPALQGGLIGWAGGKGIPGGGFNAANNHFAQQRQMLMQYAVLNRQMRNDQFRNQLEAARTQVELNKPRYLGRGSQPTAAQTPEGQTVFIARNPDTGKMEQIQGYTPPDKAEKPDATQYDSDRGVVVNRTAGTAKPVVMEGSGDQGSQEVQTGLPGVMDIARQKALPQTTPTGPLTMPTKPSGSAAASPRGIQTGADSAQGSGAGLPLGPKPTRASGWRTQAEEDAAAEYRTKNPDASAADVLRYVSALTREPKDNGLSPKEYRSRQASLITQLNVGFRQIENERQRNLKSLGEFPDPNDISQIESDTADAKTAMHQRLVDSATAEGIDIGKVPDYRAQ